MARIKSGSFCYLLNCREGVSGFNCFFSARNRSHCMRWPQGSRVLAAMIDDGPLAAGSVIAIALIVGDTASGASSANRGHPTIRYNSDRPTSGLSLRAPSLQ
jgi:hypothetical protein